MVAALREGQGEDGIAALAQRPLWMTDGIRIHFPAADASIISGGGQDLADPIEDHHADRIGMSLQDLYQVPPGRVPEKDLRIGVSGGEQASIVVEGHRISVSGRGREA